MVTLAGFTVSALFWAVAQVAHKAAVAFAPFLTQAVLERITGVKGAKA